MSKMGDWMGKLQRARAWVAEHKRAGLFAVMVACAGFIVGHLAAFCGAGG